jgi:plastocyanin
MPNETVSMRSCFLGLTVALAVASVACTKASTEAPKPAPASIEAPKPAPTEAAKAAALEKKGDGQRIEMKVTNKGFEPENLTVTKGQPVTLVITRVTEKTCATEIVIDELGVNTKLPLNQAVNVTFTPTKSGELKYGCAMGKMIGGVLKVI